MSGKVAVERVKLVEQEHLPKGQEPIELAGRELTITMESDDMESLTIHGRKACMDFVEADPRYSSFATAGVEKVTGPIAFDPVNPEADPYTNPRPETQYLYRQTFRLTRMI